ncbi:hypothetical protein J6590_001446 [Homalodisca vitripennis]|nr:hypothetical protein J6590_001446 [Homalodisca vitripennis]
MFAPKVPYRLDAGRSDKQPAFGAEKLHRHEVLTFQLTYTTEQHIGLLSFLHEIFAFQSD